MLVCYYVCARVYICVCVLVAEEAGGGGPGLLGRCSYRLGLFQIRCEIPSTHHQLEDISVRSLLRIQTVFVRIVETRFTFTGSPANKQAACLSDDPHSANAL